MTRDPLVAPKMLCPGTLLRNSNLEIGKNYKKIDKVSSY